jgi:hypothetical protein
VEHVQAIQKGEGQSDEEEHEQDRPVADDGAGRQRVSHGVPYSRSRRCPRGRQFGSVFLRLRVRSRRGVTEGGGCRRLARRHRRRRGGGDRLFIASRARSAAGETTWGGARDGRWSLFMVIRGEEVTAGDARCRTSRFPLIRPTLLPSTQTYCTPTNYRASRRFAAAATSDLLTVTPRPFLAISSLATPVHFCLFKMDRNKVKRPRSSTPSKGGKNGRRASDLPPRFPRSTS